MNSYEIVPVVVVEVSHLDCLDCLLWLRTGDNVARRLNCTQATVSRTTKRTCSTFGIELSKSNGEWSVSGNQLLLNLERAVHQVHRWNTGLPLRIEAQHHSGPLYLDPPPDKCILGNMDFADYHTPINLLRDGVIDVHIACYPDVPPEECSEFACYHLTRYPVRLAVATMHPLARMGSVVTLDDVKKFPSLAMRDGAFPKIQSILSGIGLWTASSMSFRYDHSKWEGMAEDLATVCYVSPINSTMFDFPITILPIAIPLSAGETVVVKRTYVDHPRFHSLLETLKLRAHNISKKYADVKIMF
ncbi:hypothetical protein [Synechococcus sp. BA-132 BA5]|uniref:hypothetical protein n=1 Tax=Synechococcus sp. BA-132 BA5 TaxID=3110252 RepID=UPI002B1F45DE|nr:hypothetical protein [Synechococcus sp. BA-132 BA5]MEA5414092.1 hypothetical protein [Synechococcus sp. BA-132 BA5]